MSREELWVGTGEKDLSKYRGKKSLLNIIRSVQEVNDALLTLIE